MSLGSPRASEAGRLVYHEGPEVDPDGTEGFDSATSPLAGDGAIEKYESMYVVLFEGMWPSLGI
jgi:hypothetical protein